MTIPNPEYPQRFDIPTAPENRFIELCRILAIALMLGAAIIAALGGAIIFVKQHHNSKAVVIMADPRPNTKTALSSNQGKWVVIDESKDWSTDEQRKMTMRLIQESVARDFVRRWFSVSYSRAANEANWKTCDRDNGRCGVVEENMGSELCCMTNSEVFRNFVNNFVVIYWRMFDSKKSQAVATNDRGEVDVAAEPIGNVEFSGSGTMWRLKFDVIDYDVSGNSNLVQRGRKPVEAFVRISTNNQTYPKHMGQYVSEFYYFWE
ncbi:MAG: hypothetical protein LBB23_00805 [Rickettsiales bacterium]|jgi:hypothetical protein|nr:hypothetical protein [Rickettsiales bacterium]